MIRPHRKHWGSRPDTEGSTACTDVDCRGVGTTQVSTEGISCLATNPRVGRRVWKCEGNGVLSHIFSSSQDPARISAVTQEKEAT